MLDEVDEVGKPRNVGPAHHGAGSGQRRHVLTGADNARGPDTSPVRVPLRPTTVQGAQRRDESAAQSGRAELAGPPPEQGVRDAERVQHLAGDEVDQLLAVAAAPAP